MVTPMTEAGEIDLQAWEGLLQWHAQQGTDVIVVVGTTGESPTVTLAEAGELVRRAVMVLGDRVPVIAGTGTNSTAGTIERTRALAAAGAQAALVVTPYYNKPTQEGLYRHFRAIAEKVELPLLLYNVPGRTVADMSNDTILRLSEIPNIVGVKDATGNIERGTDLIRRAHPDFALYSGDDASALAFILLGGHGTISVTANVVPRQMHEMCAAALMGELHRAREINQRIFGLHRSLFVEANPIPVKWAVQQLGLIEGGIRLPLTPLSAEHFDRIHHAMREAGLAV